MEQIRNGMNVRSFDFAGNSDVDGPRACYIEGVVIQERNEENGDYARCVIRVVKDVYRGNSLVQGPHSRVGILVYPPINGLTTLWCTTNFIHQLDAEAVAA